MTLRDLLEQNKKYNKNKKFFWEFVKYYSDVEEALTNPKKKLTIAHIEKMAYLTGHSFELLVSIIRMSQKAPEKYSRREMLMSDQNRKKYLKEETVNRQKELEKIKKEKNFNIDEILQKR